MPHRDCFEETLREMGYKTRRCKKCGFVQYKIGHVWNCYECNRQRDARQK